MNECRKPECSAEKQEIYQFITNDVYRYCFGTEGSI